MPLPELLDLSVNETLSRTVMTSLTLLIALLPLLFLGPASLFGLAAGITLGLFVGTYSSVYMASPFLIWLRSGEHTSELQSLMRISYAVFCLNKKKITIILNK